MPHWLELGKFALYVSLPAGFAYLVTSPETINKIINHYKFVVYPPANPEHAAQLTAMEQEHRQRREQRLSSSSSSPPSPSQQQRS